MSNVAFTRARRRERERHEEVLATVATLLAVTEKRKKMSASSFPTVAVSRKEEKAAREKNRREKIISWLRALVSRTYVSRREGKSSSVCVSSLTAASCVIEVIFFCQKQLHFIIEARKDLGRKKRREKKVCIKKRRL